MYSPSSTFKSFLLLGLSISLFSGFSGFSNLSAQSFPEPPPKEQTPPENKESEETVLAYLSEYTIFRISSLASSHFTAKEVILSFAASKSIKAGTISHKPPTTSSLMAGTMLLFAEATFTFPHSTLKVDQEGISWKNRLGGSEDLIEKVSAPKVLALAGQAASISIEGEQTFQYMEPDPKEKSCYHLKETKFNTGLKIYQKLMEKDGKIHLDPLEIQVDFVQDREKIEEVDLNIGKPLLSTSKSSISVTLNPDQTYGLIWQTEQGAIMVVFKFSPHLEKLEKKALKEKKKGDKIKVKKK